MELGGDLPHGESLIVVKLQHLLLPLREHLLAGKAQIPAQPFPAGSDREAPRSDFGSRRRVPRKQQTFPTVS